MKAPEKLYVDTDDRLSDSILYGFTEKSKEDDIEYTRTDAFMEKACNFIDERLNFDDNAWYIEGEVTVKDKVIEDFKNYIKGE